MRRTFKQADIIQDEAAECGLACISYISGFYGRNLRLEKLRSHYDVTSDGLSFHHLMRICAEHDLAANAVKVTAESLDELDKPAILLWNNCHFIVLKKVSKNKIEVMDPAAGTRYFTIQDAVSFFSGFALEVSPTENFVVDNKKNKQQDKKRHQHFFSWQSFKNGAVRYKSYMTPFLILAIIIQMTNIAVPKFMSLVFDEVLPKNDVEFLWLLVFIFAFIYLVQALGSYIKIILSQRLRRAISQHEGLRAVQKLFQMDLKFFNKRFPSDLLRKIKSVDVFHIIYTHGWLDIAVETFFAGVFLTLLFFINFELALLTTAITVVMIVIRIMLLSRLMSYQYSALDAEIRRDNVLLKAIDNIIPVKINHSEHKKVNAWFTEHAELELNRSSIEKTSSVIQLSITTISHIQTLVIMGIGAYNVLNGENTAGQLISFIFYKNSFIANIQSVVEKHVTLQLCSVEVKRLMDINPQLQPGRNNYQTSISGRFEKIRNIQLKNISFSYSNLDDLFIRDINIHLSPGQKLVITGSSGSGKTTILKIFAGLLQPSCGEVLVNGIELRRFGVSQYQQQLSLVSPDDTIIDGSVVENIIYECDHYDLLLLERCIDDADLTEVIKSLSAGINTMLGTNGARLSSGQQQRLILARALYRRPNLILLDEPTSHLDRQSASQVIALIKRISVSCVIVSHDQDVIESFDNHLSVTKGAQ